MNAIDPQADRLSSQARVLHNSSWTLKYVAAAIRAAMPRIQRAAFSLLLIIGFIRRVRTRCPRTNSSEDAPSQNGMGSASELRR